MALTTQQETIASAGMLGVSIGAAVGYVTSPKRFRGDDALRYGLLLGAVGAVGAAIFTSTTANAATSTSVVETSTTDQLAQLVASSLV